MRRAVEPAADEEKAIGKPEPMPKDADSGEENKENQGSRLAMTLREAEVIARNLKESGTRR